MSFLVGIVQTRLDINDVGNLRAGIVINRKVRKKALSSLYLAFWQVYRHGNYMYMQSEKGNTQILFCNAKRWSMAV